MNRSLFFACAMAALALAGCGRGKVSTDGLPPEDNETRLGDACPHDLAGWLAKPRAELAKLAEEQEALIATQREALPNQAPEQMLLPKLAAPNDPPVFRKARFDPDAGLSLPAYAPAGKADPALAAHLARFGDHEAAAKFVGADPDAARAVEALRATKNYPAEWSRLVGLALTSAQNKLAVGDAEGAAELVGIHRQIRPLLDDKAAAGPLGAALLPAGRRAVAQAAAAYREPRWNKPALAADLEKAVAEWGELPPPPSALGRAKAEVEAQLAAKANGRAVAAADLDRAADLLALPLPSEAVACVVALLDKDGRSCEILVGYRGKLDAVYPATDHLAFRLDEAGLAAKAGPKNPGLARTSYEAKDTYEIARLTRGAGLGAVARVGDGKPAVASGLRELGPVSLDRGFEANRVGWVPARSGPLATVEDKQALAALAAGCGLPAPTLAVLQRDPAEDLVLALRVTWAGETGAEGSARLLRALASFGPPSLEGVEDGAGSALVFRWQDAATRAELRLPYDDKPPVLSVEDAQPAAAKAQRVRLARKRDEGELAGRAAAGAERVTLDRSPGKVNDFSLAGLSLGQSKAEAEAALPKGKEYRVRPVPGGVHLLALSQPVEPVPYWAGQVLVRFEGDRVSEIRVRYAEGKANKGESLFDRLCQGKAGQPETVAATWAGLWGDLPPREPKLAMFRWQDDRTTRTYQRDAGGGEVTYRDRAAAPTPWRFVSRGPKGVTLGEDKQKIDKASPPIGTANGATVYRGESKGPYESYMVWYEKGRAERIVAVHREVAGATPEQVTAGLNKAWGAEVDERGAIRRRDGRRGPILGAYSWHDDATRVQTFAQLGEGARLMTEWRSWPVAPSGATAKK